MIKRVLLLALVVMSFLFWGSCKNADEKRSKEPKAVVTTYYLIRHAEKDRSDTTNTNPALSSIGSLRATYWAAYFDTIPLKEIYSTNFIRTQQTVLPISTAKQIVVQPYEPKSFITSDFLKKTKGFSVLISGHSNTTPKMVNQLIGSEKFSDMDDNDNSSLYVVKFSDSVPTVEIRTVNLPEE